MLAWLRRIFGMTDKLSWGNPDAPSKGGGASSHLVATIDGVQIHQRGDVVYWTSGLQIDADGSPRAYHPQSGLGLDRLSNAGRPGHWYGILTDNGRPDGEPVIQGPRDPAPGYYISTTALRDVDYSNWSDPHQFVDSERVPFIVLPNRPGVFGMGTGTHIPMGDFAVVVNLSNGKKCAAICADLGPADEIGEGSIALAQALGVDEDARTGGCADNILFVLFAGSRTTPAWPHTLTEINARVAGLVTQNHLNLPNLATV